MFRAFSRNWVGHRKFRSRGRFSATKAAIARWRTEVWPELRRRAVAERRTLVFVDESGFYLLPGVVRTYGPQGQTPVVDKKLTRDHLSVMAGVTPAGKAVYVGSSRIADEFGKRGLPEALARANGQEVVGDLGWIADSPLGSRSRILGGGGARSESTWRQCPDTLRI